MSSIASGTTSTTALVYTADTTGNLVLQTNGTTTAVTIDTSQRVGIGTTSPETKLNVSGGLATTGIVSYFENASSGANVKLHFSDATTYNWTCGTTGNNFTWSTGEYGTTAGTERMRLDSSGNLGLGVTPSAWGSGLKAVEVGGSNSYLAFNNTSASGYVYWNMWNDGTNNKTKQTGYIGAYGLNASGAHVWFNGSGTANTTSSLTQAMTLSNAGNLQVPAMYSTTVTTPRNVFIDSSGNLGGISSTRASKSNIVNQDSASWIYQLTPVTFNYRKKDADGNYTEEVESEVQYGLIAEDVEGIKPEFCIYVNGKLAGVHYDRMVSPIIKALQELNAKFESYKATHP